MTDSKKYIILIANGVNEKTICTAETPVVVDDKAVLWCRPRRVESTCEKLSISTIGLHSNNEFGGSLKKNILRDTYNTLVGEYTMDGEWKHDVQTLLTDPGNDVLRKKDWHAAYQNFVNRIREQNEHHRYWKAYQHALPFLLSRGVNTLGETEKEILSEDRLTAHKKGDEWTVDTLSEAFDQWKQQLTAPGQGESP